MANRFLIVIFLILINTLYCIAEEGGVETLYLSTQTGLTSNHVTSLEQDHHGYIWVGTSHGLNRLDGHEVYTWNMSQYSSQECHITDLKADKANNCLWVFNKKGLFGCIDLSTFKLIPYPAKDIDSIYTNHHHPEGQVLSNLFSRRIQYQDTGSVTVSAAKTGYVEESGFCAASYGTTTDGREYLCVTGKSTGTQQSIKDHAELYRTYCPKAEVVTTETA